MTVISLLKYKSNVWVDGWIDIKIKRTDKIAMSVSCIKPVTISIEHLFAFVCHQYFQCLEPVVEPPILSAESA